MDKQKVKQFLEGEITASQLFEQDIQYQSLDDATQLTGNDMYSGGQTEVWYMKKEFVRDLRSDISFADNAEEVREAFRKAVGSAPENPEDLKKTHVLLGTVDSTDKSEIFHAMQGEVWSPNGEARSLIKEKGLGHTSASIGDVIVLPNDEIHVAVRIGFELIA